MKVSVIISVFSFDRLKEVIDCVKSLELQSLFTEEILVVLDPDEELINFYKSKLPKTTKLVISEKKGLSNARNAGIRAAKGEIVAFIDDDAVAESDWLENLVKNYDDPSVVGVGGLITPKWKGKRPKWFSAELNWVVGCSYLGLPKKKAFVRNVIGCNMSFRRTVFDKIGYFKSDVGRFGKNLLGSEEPELSTRILGKIPNSKIIYDPEAVVHHNVPKSRQKISYLWRRSFYEGLNKAILVSSKKNSVTTLSTENKYMKYILRHSIPSRVKRCYRFKNLAQLFILFVSFFAVFLGFVTGKILRH